MSFAVVKIGGCNGSGKTTLARAIMAHVGGMGNFVGDARPPKKVDGYIAAYSVAKVILLGDYAPHRACGGMDTISDKYDRFNLVKKHAKKGNVVFFEGLITGKTYGALGELSESKGQMGRWLYAMMDTSFEECVRRVLQRRAAAGNTNPFDPERTMRPTYKSIHSTAARAAERGHQVYWVSHKDKPEVAARKLMDRAMEVYRAS